jgi:hypothetical protein
MELTGEKFLPHDIIIIIIVVVIISTPLAVSR